MYSRSLLAVVALGSTLALSACGSPAVDGEPSASTDVAVASAAPTLDDRPLGEQLADAVRGGDAVLATLALDAGADPNHEVGAGLSALAVAVVRDDVETVQALIDAGADLEATDPDGNTALLLAAANAGPDVVTALVEAGASFDVFATDAANATPLHAAVRARNVPALRTLLGLGAPVDTRNLRYEATALHAAAFWDCVECAEALVLAGADTNAVEVAGFTPLEVARGEGHTEVAAFLESLE